jgi:plasmid stability protein
MPTITLKDVPDALHRKLKRSAELHHRSLNGEIIARLEAEFAPRAADVQARIEAARRLRERLKPVRHDLVDGFKRQSRP